MVLMSVLMGLCLAIGYFLGGGRPQFMVGALVFGGIMNFVAFFFSDKIALATMRAKEIKRADDPGLWDIYRAAMHAGKSSDAQGICFSGSGTERIRDRSKSSS